MGVFRLPPQEPTCGAPLRLIPHITRCPAGGAGACVRVRFYLFYFGWWPVYWVSLDICPSRQDIQAVAGTINTSPPDTKNYSALNCTWHVVNPDYETQRVPTTIFFATSYFIKEADIVVCTCFLLQWLINRYATRTTETSLWLSKRTKTSPGPLRRNFGSTWLPRMLATLLRPSTVTFTPLFDAYHNRRLLLWLLLRRRWWNGVANLRLSNFEWPIHPARYWQVLRACQW